MRIAHAMFIFAFALSGCYRIRRSINGPDVPPLIVAGADLDILKHRIQCDRRTAMEGPGDGMLTCGAGDNTVSVPKTITATERNNVQQLLLTAADERYFKTRANLLNSRNALTFGAEVTGVTLSSVSAILGSPETKTILSTTSALVQSTKTSIDKNYFADQTSSALVNQMDALRARKQAQILESERKEVADYGFEQAMNDALIYDDAGSVHSALLALNANAGASNQQAQEVLRTAQK